jgi:hypothetical protein
MPPATPLHGEFSSTTSVASPEQSKVRTTMERFARSIPSAPVFFNPTREAIKIQYADTTKQRTSDTPDQRLAFAGLLYKKDIVVKHMLQIHEE